MDQAGPLVLEVFSGLKVTDLKFIEELPQESVSLKRSDYILQVTDTNGERFNVIWEFLSIWREDAVLNLMDYAIRCKLKYGLKIFPVVILLKQSDKARNYYKDENFRFRFHLTRIYKFKASHFLQSSDVHLLPFIPLMEGADEETVFAAEKKIYNSTLSTPEKADLLTAMAIFAGLKDKDLALNLTRRRRDIMKESYAYEIIKKEGFEEGFGEGFGEGIQKGELTRARKAVIEVLEVNLAFVPLDVVRKLNMINDIHILETLIKKAVKTANVDEFKEVLNKMEAF